MIEEELGLPIEQLFLEFDDDADRGGVDRPGAPRGAPERAPRRGQGAAPERAAADRGRPRAALPGRAARAGARPRARLHRRARSSSTSSRARSARSSTTGSRRATPRRSTATSPATRTSRVPRVYWSYTRARVLTLEFLEGVAARRPRRSTRGRSRSAARLAYLMTETWMTMIFRHGFFHGDPHPGEHPRARRRRADRARRLRPGRQAHRRRHVEADAALHRRRERERRALPRRLAELGVRYPKEREEEFVAELRELYYRYYGASLAEIDPLQVIREALPADLLDEPALPTRFVLLDKAIATLGSVGVELYPDFNVFEVAKPYARDADARALHAAARAGARARREGARARARSRASCRTRCTTSSRRCATARSRSASCTRASTSSCSKLDVAFNRLVIALVVAGGLIGSSLIGIFAKAGPHIARRARPLVRRLRALGRARALAPLGRDPLRPAVETSSQFRAKGHLAAAPSRGASVGCMSRALLLAEPEPGTREFLERHLASDGLRGARRGGAAAGARAGRAGAARPRARGGLEDASGLDVCRCLREGEPGRSWDRDVPVIVLGEARADAVDRVHAFERGCDDFVPRPFHYEELRRPDPRRAAADASGRARAAGRRAARDRPGDAARDGSTACPSRSPAKEYELLVKLATEPTRVFTKEELLREVWGFVSLGRTRTLDSHASRLRRKLALAGAEGCVVNVWGVGYRLLAGEEVVRSTAPEPPSRYARARGRRRSRHDGSGRARGRGALRAAPQRGHRVRSPPDVGSDSAFEGIGGDGGQREILVAQRRPRAGARAARARPSPEPRLVRPQALTE